ncbi:MAG: hypothetical protein QY310_08000 [Candidatus Jettenia sp. CY-1]|nr:MAG: hypothetical protein QY310_08000 [Candidatus Jettenia sp. CY-1]
MGNGSYCSSQWIGILYPYRCGTAVDIISNVAKDPTDIPVRISRFCPKTVTVNLIAREVVADLAPGKKFWF